MARSTGLRCNRLHTEPPARHRTGKVIQLLSVDDFLGYRVLPRSRQVSIADLRAGRQNGQQMRVITRRSVQFTAGVGETLGVEVRANLTQTELFILLSRLIDVALFNYL